MSDNQINSTRDIIQQIRKVLSRQFSVRADQASYAEIDKSIRDMVEFKGTNLWVLMFAIIIASVGLNVNSTAVIIGAMLISPLMGPIMGIGYGIGINDFELIKKSFKSITIAVLISLLSATLYFLISPLSEARSELLARTTPTLWDVLIALFGGLAGILASTRKEKSNVIPGVAIATALMPPLCTAGYGLATGHLSYFFGAFYLFFINVVFIALATMLFIGYLNPPHKHLLDSTMERRVRNYIIALVLITVLPSIYLAYNMVTDVAFNARARDFINNELTFENTLTTQEKISPSDSKIEVTFVGTPISKEKLAAIEKRLKNYNLENVQLEVHQPSEKTLDINSLKSNLLRELYSVNVKASEDKDTRIRELDMELSKIKAGETEGQNITRELATLYPGIVQVSVARAPLWKADGSKVGNSLIAYLIVTRTIRRSEHQKIIDWLKVRTNMEFVKLVVVRS